MLRVLLIALLVARVAASPGVPEHILNLAQKLTTDVESINRDYTSWPRILLCVAMHRVLEWWDMVERDLDMADMFSGAEGMSHASRAKGYIAQDHPKHNAIANIR